MNASFAAIQEFLVKGDLARASDAFAHIRPGDKTSLEGLHLSAKIHMAARRFEQVDVLCRVLRKEYPDESSGFHLGAESLHLQGRTPEAISLLRSRQPGVSNDETLKAIARFEDGPIA